MLISHARKFIYLKTMKTAGTSVEIFFERYCKPADQSEREDDERRELVSAEGIVGYRGPDRGGSVWYGHMRAADVKELIGDEIWNGYLKFCVVRNPFDQLVSYWWMLGAGAHAGRAANDFAFARDRFSRWILDTPHLPANRPIYSIDGKSCVDEFIRFEKLVAGITRICELAGVPADVGRLRRFKGGHRRRPETYRTYYTPEARQRVERELTDDLVSLGYSFE